MADGFTVPAVWRDQPLPPGPVVIFDLDGVLSDAAGRQHYLAGPGRKDWDGFFAASGDDPIIEETARLLELLDDELGVVLLTARPDTVRDATLAWLARYGLRWDLLIMRAAKDWRPSPEVKREALRQLRDAGYDVRLAFEDDRRNVDVFRAEGVPCLYVHSGYYE